MKFSIDRFGQRFWLLTQFILDSRARFDDVALAFDLERPPREDLVEGRYHLISKSAPRQSDAGSGERDTFLYRLSHPLGEHVVDEARALIAPPARVVFDVTNHPARVHVVEVMKGLTGYLTLSRLAVDSFEREEHLLFSGFDEDGRSLDQETIEKLFGCSAHVHETIALPDAASARLAADADRHAKATVSRVLEANSQHFNEAREKLEKWADDMVLSAEKALKDTKEQIKALRREARQAVTMEEQHVIQEKIQKLEKQQRRQRQDIFKAEDEIMEKRDSLIERLERRLAQKTEIESLFTIQWAVE